MINTLVIGSGGREHALAWSLSRSARVGQVFVAPGNGGTRWPGHASRSAWAAGAPAQNVGIAVNDVEALVAFARDNAVQLTVVGPENPLANGIVDAFQAAGLKAFGPSRAAARLEASKAFAKDFMRASHIPTAEYGVFTDYETAKDFLVDFNRPVVVKADGLAEGKGVLVCDTPAEADAALNTILRERAFGAAGETVVIEERLTGREISVLVFSDGKVCAPMPVARDHKRALDGDHGPNTGGMGAFAPAADVPQSLIDEIVQTIVQPTLDGLAARGAPYVGVLYVGLMLTAGGPQVLEFNCRFGDPETQVILPLLETDLLDVLMACVDGRLAEVELRWRDKTCATVVLASPGYPARYPKGLPISGLDQLSSFEDAFAFHAGTTYTDGRLVTAGGRVLGITALGDDLPQALARAYRGASLVHFEGMHYRRDIGQTLVGSGAR